MFGPSLILRRRILKTGETPRVLVVAGASESFSAVLLLHRLGGADIAEGSRRVRRVGPRLPSRGQLLRKHLENQ
jgi:hypothetical protein